MAGAALPMWRQAHPEIALEVIGTDAVIDLFKGEADIAIRYQRCPPAGLVADELFRDSFWPVCSPDLIGAAPIRTTADLVAHTLIHLHWQPWEPSPPTWQTWLDATRARDGQGPAASCITALSFREELHAIEAVLAGQGIAILSDVLVARELASGRLIKVFDLPLPGFGFYFARVPDHPRQAVIQSFHDWIKKPVV